MKTASQLFILLGQDSICAPVHATASKGLQGSKVFCASINLVGFLAWLIQKEQRLRLVLWGFRTVVRATSLALLSSSFRRGQCPFTCSGATKNVHRTRQTEGPGAAWREQVAGCGAGGSLCSGHS